MNKGSIHKPAQGRSFLKGKDGKPLVSNKENYVRHFSKVIKHRRKRREMAIKSQRINRLKNKKKRR